MGGNHVWDYKLCLLPGNPEVSNLLEEATAATLLDYRAVRIWFISYHKLNKYFLKNVFVLNSAATSEISDGKYMYISEFP